MKRGLNLALVSTRAGEEYTTKLSLDEELSVEDLGGGVEGGSRDRWVDVIGGSDRVPVEL